MTHFPHIALLSDAHKYSIPNSFLKSPPKTVFNSYFFGLLNLVFYLFSLILSQLNTPDPLIWSCLLQDLMPFAISIIPLFLAKSLP